MVTKREQSKGRRTFKDWYDENKKKLNAKKKERYENDPKYKDAARQRVRDKYNAENRIFEDGSRVVTIDGVEYVAYKLSDAAEMLEINLNTLRGYFQRGYLPLIHFDDTQLKLVTVEQLRLIKRFIDATEDLTPMQAAEKHSKYINKHWRDSHGSKKIINKAK